MILPNQEEGEEDSEETMDDDFDFDDFDDININDAGGGLGNGGNGPGMGDGLDDSSEASVEDRASARAKELGYRPQKEVIYNKLLPYSDKLDAESAVVWRSVKGELGWVF